MAPPTRSRLNAATVQRARVLDVDTNSYTLTVATEFTKKPLTWISFAVPYLHPNNGEGIFFMPEVGSICWLVEPSDGGMPFVMAWASVENKSASHRMRRLAINPGDIVSMTRDENFLILRRGGVTQIGATPLAQRFYIPIDNIIRDLCENYQLQSLAGEMSFEVGRPEETEAGKRPTRWKLNVRQHADDPDPIAELQIGSHPGNPTRILSLAVYASGEKGAAHPFMLTVDNSGTIKIVAPQMVLSEALSVGTSLDVGGDTRYEAIIASSDFEEWVKQVSLCLSGTGAASKSPAVIKPTQHKAKNLKSS